MKKTVFNILAIFENILRWCLLFIALIAVITLIELGTPQSWGEKFFDHSDKIAAFFWIFVILIILFAALSRKTYSIKSFGRLHNLYAYKKPDYSKAFPFPLLTITAIVVVVWAIWIAF